MAYSSHSVVRRKAGFSNNFDVTTAAITGAIARADAIVNGKIGDVYALPLTYVGSFVREASEELAVAILLQEEYGPEVENADKDGYLKMRQWVNDSRTGLLDQVQDKTVKIYRDDTGVEITRNDAYDPSFYPNNASNDDADNSTEPKIGMNDKF